MVVSSLIRSGLVLCRRHGRIGFSCDGAGGGGDGPAKVILTLDDLVFINTQLSKRVSVYRMAS